MATQSESPKQNPKAGQSRRDVLRFGAAAAAGAMAFPFILPQRAKGANDRIRVASIGVGGKGDGDSSQCVKAGADMVAICDVDKNTLNKKAKEFPAAKAYQDFRKLFAEMEKDFDAVTVSTPDHMHGLIAATAMKAGKHVYCQKPLTQTVFEARTLRTLAKNPKIATQMGNQGSAGSGLRRAVECIQAGIIGNVREVHVWSNRPIWPQGINRPEGEDPVPANLDWDVWLGVAPKRPFKAGVYHGFKWRGWYDFGTGALGDMACHTVNMPFRAVKMGFPNVVECEKTSQLFPETYPLTSRIRYEFPEREGLPPCKFWWYDGNPSDPSSLRPDPEITKNVVALKGKLTGSGALLIGDKGEVFSDDDYGSAFYVKLKEDAKYKGSGNHEATKAIPETLPRAPKGDNDLAMKLEWMQMMKDGTPSFSNFDIAAYLTEIILLGCVAMHVGVGTKMDWDGPNMKSTNVAEAAKFVKRENRAGFEMNI